MLRAATLFATLAFVLSCATYAQTIQGMHDDPPPDHSQRSHEMGAPEAEMLRRAEIRREEDVHKEMVERADEAAQLGDELLASYKKNNALTREDLKRLERLEKLARKIRGSAGGSDDDDELADPPGKIEGAVSRLAKLTGALKESVTKTSRLVISASVIEHSNEMIELIRHIRSIKQP
jgi:hypothetical protein